MQNWRLRFLGIDSIPGWLSALEIEQFFTLTASEIATVRTRRGEALQLGLATGTGTAYWLLAHGRLCVKPRNRS